MTKTQEIMDLLTGQKNVDVLISSLTVLFEDFSEVREQYVRSIQILKEELGEKIVDAEVNAIRQQVASDLLFSGLLGIKANLDNFINPISRNFLDVDSEVYLREEIAHSLPAYNSAQNTRNQFFASLTAKQRQTYNAITEYFCYLETAGPKLAHYYGYLIGNELLPRVVPGYHNDSVLTARYKRMLADCFGKSF